MTRSDARVLAFVVVMMFVVFCVLGVVLIIAAKRRRRANGQSGGPPGAPPLRSEFESYGPARKFGSLLGRVAAQAEQFAGPAAAAVEKAANDAARAVDRALNKARERHHKKSSPGWRWGGSRTEPGGKVEAYGPGGRREPVAPDADGPPSPTSDDRVPPIEVFGPDGARRPASPPAERPIPSPPKSEPTPLPPEELGPIDEKRAAAALAGEGWHVLKDADVYGPMPLADLRTRLKDLGPQTRIWVKGYRTWVEAASVPGLLAA